LLISTDLKQSAEHLVRSHPASVSCSADGQEQAIHGVPGSPKPMYMVWRDPHRVTCSILLALMKTKGKRHKI